MELNGVRTVNCAIEERCSRPLLDSIGGPNPITMESTYPDCRFLLSNLLKTHAQCCANVKVAACHNQQSTAKEQYDLGLACCWTLDVFCCNNKFQVCDLMTADR